MAPEEQVPRAFQPADVIDSREVTALQGSRVDTAASVEAQPGEPLTATQKTKATVRVRYPVDVLEHGVEGVPPVTSAGVEVPPAKVEALLAAASSAATELEVITSL